MAEKEYQIEQFINFVERKTEAINKYSDKDPSEVRFYCFQLLDSIQNIREYLDSIKNGE